MADMEQRIAEAKAKYMGKLVRLMRDGEPHHSLPGVVVDIEPGSHSSLNLKVTYDGGRTWYFDWSGWTLEIHPEQVER